jgi:transposase
VVGVFGAGGPSGSAEELAVLVGRLRTENADLRTENAEQAAVIGELRERVGQLERRLGADSQSSSRPPSTDAPYRKPKGGSSRKKSDRKPGKQPGQPGSTMPLVDDPDEVITCDQRECGSCGADLSSAAVIEVRRRQVTDVDPPPPPRVTEYRLLMRTCPCCGARRPAPAPPGVAARAQYGPRVLSRAAELLCAHYLPVARATALMASLVGVEVSSGFMAGVRARAARLIEDSFLPHVRNLLRRVGVVHVDETPGRAAGGLRYIHIACTEHLTALHTGGRGKADIDAGGVLPGYAGTIVRDGYIGYQHLVDAHHAWCGAHLLRELRGIHRADPDGQAWAQAIATTLTDALTATRAARDAGKDHLDADTLTTIKNRYRGAADTGIADNRARAGPLAADAATLARRFHKHETMILRFVDDLAVPFTNNQGERDLRPVKIQQRTSGGCWRTLSGLADFAVVHSYLSTATKWGFTTLDALHQLFTTGPWLPPAPQPAE